MSRDESRGAYRAPARARAAVLVGALVGALLIGGTVPYPASAESVTRVAEPSTAPGETPDGEPPTSPPQTEPPQTESPSPPPVESSPTTEPPATEPPASPPPVEPTVAPPTRTPPPNASPTPVAPPPPGQPGPVRPGEPARGVSVVTDDLTLGQPYWSGAGAVADLRVTVANTGLVAERMRLAYAMPAGLVDAGTRGCAAVGTGAWECAPWIVAPGARFSTRIQVRVDGDAWRRMPLSGSVRVTSTPPTDPAAQAITDHQGFAVLFPAGPPVPGVSLAASEVNFDVTGQPTTLEVRLGNTGRAAANGVVEVVLPPGVTVPNAPAGCVAAGADRTRCDVGPIGAGGTGTARLPVAATLDAQRNAPLSGAVIGVLQPRAGDPLTVRMSFRITAVAALATPPAERGVGPTGSQGALPPVASDGDTDGGLSSVQKTGIALISASVLLVVLALGLATTSLRRRISDVPPPVAEAAVPAE